MTLFKLTLKNGEQQQIDALNKQELIDKFFDKDENHFKAEVSKLEWAERTLHCSENVQTGEIDRRIIGADTNPYGWRKEAGG